MKKTLLWSFLLLTLFNFSSLNAAGISEKPIFFDDPITVSVYDGVIFYDGYAGTVSEPVQDGMIRLDNTRYGKKLTDDVLDSFGNKITMNVTIGARCDNYDRIGGVHLAFVPKGETTYNTDEVRKLEIGRFITPFMNKNISPTQVPYSFEVDNLYGIFNDASIRENYDIWIELEVFGVPYAAQTQVSGCSTRIDTFTGWLSFSTYTDPSIPAYTNFLLTMSDSQNLNNYNATDVEGETIRLIDFILENEVQNAKFYLITSNHGANSGGEEYVRRQHYVYLNNQEILTYKPGGISCEPFRQYNTQANGIYGTSPMTEAQWTSWNNWCPGNSIPIRPIELNNLSPGEYTFKLDVPDAVFNGQQGYIPVSLYLQGQQDDLAVSNVSVTDVTIYPNPVTNLVKVKSQKEVSKITLIGSNGQILNTFYGNEANIATYPKGIYFIKVDFVGGMSFKHKIIKK